MENNLELNEVLHNMGDMVQWVCIIIQSIIIYKQFKLSKEVNNSNKANEKGIFLLDDTNIFPNSKFFINKYDLGKELYFHNKGNGNVIVKGISINKRFCENGYKTFFTNIKEYSKLNIDLYLSEEELKKDELFFEIKLELENLKGYSYFEMIEVGFKKDKQEKVFNKTFFNIKIFD